MDHNALRPHKRLRVESTTTVYEDYKDNDRPTPQARPVFTFTLQYCDDTVSFSSSDHNITSVTRAAPTAPKTTSTTMEHKAPAFAPTDLQRHCQRPQLLLQDN